MPSGWPARSSPRPVRRARVTATADRRAALAGADYVINEMQVGGYDATRADFDIPARYGVRQTIGDTLGIGGIFRGLRTIPVVLALAQDMHDVCPDAYLLSYSNPMAMLPWAVYEGTPFNRVFGLCHSVRDTQAFLTELVGADPDRVRFLTAGFNHQAFVLRFEQDGQSLYPKLAEVIDRLAGAAAPGPGGDLPPVRLLPDRVQRALRRVRAVVHAARRRRSSGSASSSATTWSDPRRTCANWTRCRPTWTRARRST